MHIVLLLRAAKDFNIDLSKSYMIGDDDRDVEVGINSNCKDSIKIETNKDEGLLNTIKQILQ